MKDLRVMYQEKLEELGASNEQIERVNVTRLKEHLRKEVHGLCEEKEGKCILLTLNGAIGRAVFEASMKSTKDDRIILSQAASIIRKHLFTKNECFDGNLSVNNQKSSVPIHLLHLLGLIFEECKQYDKVSNSTEDMIVKLAQLITFNAVKGQSSPLLKVPEEIMQMKRNAILNRMNHPYHYLLVYLFIPKRGKKE